VPVKLALRYYYPGVCRDEAGSRGGPCQRYQRNGHESQESQFKFGALEHNSEQHASVTHVTPVEQRSTFFRAQLSLMSHQHGQNILKRKLFPEKLLRFMDRLKKVITHEGWSIGFGLNI
jgi:hypothetical protein